MSDYHGDGMNTADQLCEVVIENKRLRAGLAYVADDAKLSAHRAERAEAAIARAREVIRELYVPGQTAWHWSDIETALDGAPS